MPNWAIYTDNSSPLTPLLEMLLNGPLPKGLEELEGKKGVLFSTSEVLKFLEEELRHDRKIITKGSTQNLRTMSSGERKQALFTYLLSRDPDYIVLENAFDNLDKSARENLRERILELKGKTSMIQILSRRSDLLPIITKQAAWKDGELHGVQEGVYVGGDGKEGFAPFPEKLPPAPEHTYSDLPVLVELRNVSVAFRDKRVLHQVSWKISPGDFWELRGANGSGKTTLLSMITGDSPKAYGQEIYLFGYKKGRGESVWDIKKHIGYVTPALTDRFGGYHTLEEMLISGLVDSIGLYTLPTEKQKELALAWLRLLGLEKDRNSYFHDLSKGQQRLIMCARAMIKQPLLLILDEPTADLDDPAAELVVHLINKMGKESRTAIIFVSHREEPGLKPKSVLQLNPSAKGSAGIILY